MSFRLKYFHYLILILIYNTNSVFCDQFNQEIEYNSKNEENSKSTDQQPSANYSLSESSSKLIGQYEPDKIFYFIGDSIFLANITDPVNPVIFSKIKTNLTYVNNVIIRDDAAYVLSGNQGLFILDISTPNTYVQLGNVSLKELAPDYFDQGACLILNGDIAYVGSFEYRWNMIDINNLESPSYIKSLDLPAPVTDMILKDDIIYITHFHGLSIFDVSSPLSPVEITAYTPDNFDMYDRIELYNNYVYIRTSNEGLIVLDISDLSSIEQVGSFDYRNFSSFKIKNDTLYMTCGVNGILSFDISVPSDIKPVAELNYGGSASDLIILDNYLFIADGISGLKVFETDDLIPIPVSVGNYTISNELYYSLSQNYPNPFNPSTSIQYNLKRPCNLTLKIYDSAGQLIETLFEGFQKEGQHTLKWNADNYTSGIYFCRLVTREYSEVKKMLLLH